MKIKCYKALSNVACKALANKYPALEKFQYGPFWNWFRIHYGNNESVLNSNGYKFCYISVFDHWLNQEEAFKLLDCVDQKNPQTKLLADFNKQLFENTSVLNLKPGGRRTFFGRYKSFKFREFTSAAAFNKVVEYNDNYWFPLLVLPKLEALYFPGKDLTHLLIYRDPDKIVQFKKWAKDSGLNILTME